MNSANLQRQCLCGVGVHLATKIVVLIQLIASVALMVPAAKYWLNGAILITLNITISLLLFYGLETKQPEFYLFYLVVTIVFMLAQTIFILSSVAGGGVYTFQYTAKAGFYSIYYAGNLAGLLAASVTLILFGYFCLLIPYRSYKLLISETNATQPVATFQISQPVVSFQPEPPQYYAAPQTVAFYPPPPYSTEYRYNNVGIMDPLLCCPSMLNLGIFSVVHSRRFW